MCSLEKRGKVYILTLVGNDDHRFNATTLDAISDALKLVEQSSDAAALVTTNAGKYFSNGLDLQWISEDPAARLDIIRVKFEDTLAAFMRLGIPTVAAICGHAAAGGFMLALAHDYRFMTQGRSVLYMSELDHGMHIPRSLMAVIRSKLQPAALRDVVLGARKMTAQIGMERGILDSVCEDPARTLEAAVREAEKVAARGWKRDVYCGLRLGAFPGVVEELDAHSDPPNTSGNNHINNDNNIAKDRTRETTSNPAGSPSSNNAGLAIPQPELNRANSPEEIFRIPRYSRWFSQDKIHSTERRFLTEFFDGKSAAKTPRVYKYYRDFIIDKYRENPQRKITYTEVRKNLIGDVNSVRRVFDFLENWGLINYQAASSKQQQQHSKTENNISSKNISNININNGGENVSGGGKAVLAGKVLVPPCDRGQIATATAITATDGKGSLAVDGKDDSVKDKKLEWPRVVLCNSCGAECTKFRFDCLKEIKPKSEDEVLPGSNSGINDHSAEGSKIPKQGPEEDIPQKRMEDDPKDEKNEEEVEPNGDKDKSPKKPDKLLRCPRCDSLGTKFCYYNNYNVNQPRYFCRNCQRYWTAGGTMRNVPVGAGRRKNKPLGYYDWSGMNFDDAAYCQADFVLCPKCYANGNYGPGLSAADFKRIEIKEAANQYRSVEWTDQETLLLLEAIMLHNDDWKHVAQHVGTKSEADCVTKFIQLPFGEQYMGNDGKERSDRRSSNVNVESMAIRHLSSPKDSNMQELKDNANYDYKHSTYDDISGPPLKRRQLTPFADASNPIMAQVAFLSTMAGCHVAEAAANAAVAALCEDDLSVSPITSTRLSKISNRKNGIAASMLGGLEKDFQMEDDKKELHEGTDEFTKDGEPLSGGKELTPTMEEHAAAATALESAAVRAKILVDQEEQDIEHLFSTIIGTEMKQLQEKIQHFDELEIIMEKDHLQVEEINDVLFADRLRFLQQTIRSRLSGSQGKELDRT